MKITPTEKHNRFISFSSNDGEELEIEVKYTGEANCFKAGMLDNKVIPGITLAVNEYDSLVLTLQSAVARVKIENDAGNPILSAWRRDTEKLLKRVNNL